jgi:bifunctional DNase/RNase
LTHDLLVSVLKGLGGSLDRVVISRVVDNTYFAELIIHRDEDVISVDARPSDSIAVALRTKARIFADDQLLEDVSVEISEEETVSLSQAEGSAEARASTESLKDYLRKLNPEDFGRFTP